MNGVTTDAEHDHRGQPAIMARRGRSSALETLRGTKGSILRRVSTGLDHAVRHRVVVDVTFDEPVIEKQAARWSR